MDNGRLASRSPVSICLTKSIASIAMNATKKRVQSKDNKKPMPVLLHRCYEAIRDVGMEPRPDRERSCVAAIERWINEGGAILPQRGSHS
jgi:hypothetical protein